MIVDLENQTLRDLQARLNEQEDKLAFMRKCLIVIENTEGYIRQFRGLEKPTVWFSLDSVGDSVISVHPGFINGDELTVKINCITKAIGNWVYKANKNIYEHSDLRTVFAEALENTKYAQAALNTFKDNLHKVVEHPVTSVEPYL